MTDQVIDNPEVYSDEPLDYLDQATVNRLQEMVDQANSLQDQAPELEFRFGGPRHLAKPHYQQILQRLLEVEPEVTVETSTTWSAGNLAELRDVRLTQVGTSLTWLTKTRLASLNVPEFETRLVLSQETAITPKANWQSLLQNRGLRRDRLRHTFIFNQLTMDLTQVTEHNLQTGQRGTSYEYELELPVPLDLDQLMAALQLALYFYQGSTYLYSQTIKEVVINHFNLIVSPLSQEVWTNPSALDSRFGQRARNLAYRDFASPHGALASGLVKPETGVTYTVTNKADGYSAFFYVHETGLWLLQPPLGLNRISKKTDVNLIGSVLELEIIPPIKRRADKLGVDEVVADSTQGLILNTANLGLVYDCLAVPDPVLRLREEEDYGSVGVQAQPHQRRMQLAQEIVDQFKNDEVYLLTKTFIDLRSVDDFFLILNQQLDLLTEGTFYQQDGLIFTPSNLPYNAPYQYQQLSKKEQADHSHWAKADILKWKPIEELTIDVEVRQQQLMVYDTLSRRYVPLPVDPNLSQVTNLPAKSVEGAILELAKLDQGWEMRRLRVDKTRPNTLAVVENVLRDLADPITAEVLRGQSLRLLRKYHNRLKTDLLDQKVERNATLLDLGSGRGGDVSKWGKYRRVVAVEPNPEHIQELRRRLQQAGLTSKVRIVQAGAEDTTVIGQAVRQFLGGPATRVSLMLSLSFFWLPSEMAPGSKVMLEGLLETISQNLAVGGQLVFLTIDGFTVREAMASRLWPDPKLRDQEEPSTRQLTFNGASFQLQSSIAGPYLHVSLPGTIVEEQDEGLVDLAEFRYLLERLGFKFSAIRRADSEKFMSPAERQMSSFYSFGTATNQGNVQNAPLTNQTTGQSPISSQTGSTLQPLTNQGKATALTGLGLQQTTGTGFQPLQQTTQPRTTFQQTGLQQTTGTGLQPLQQTTQPRTTFQQTGLQPLQQTTGTGFQQTTQPRTTFQQTGLQPLQQTTGTGFQPRTTFQQTTGTGFQQTTQPRTTFQQTGLQQTTQPRTTFQQTTGTGFQPLQQTGFQQTTQPRTTFQQASFQPQQRARDPNLLPTLPVAGNRSFPNLRATGDDQLADVTVQGNAFSDRQLVRIATLGEGSCLIHAILKAIYPPYAEDASYGNRIKLAEQLRQELAQYLTLPSETDPNLTNYQVLGSLAELGAANQEFTVENLQQLLRCGRELGEEAYLIVASALDINLVIVKGYRQGLQRYTSVFVTDDNSRPTLIIMGNEEHYEPIGERLDEGISTIFDRNDPLVLALSE